MNHISATYFITMYSSPAPTGQSFCNPTPTGSHICPATSSHNSQFTGSPRPLQTHFFVAYRLQEALPVLIYFQETLLGLDYFLHSSDHRQKAIPFMTHILTTHSLSRGNPDLHDPSPHRSPSIENPTPPDTCLHS